MNSADVEERFLTGIPLMVIGFIRGSIFCSSFKSGLFGLFPLLPFEVFDFCVDLFDFGFLCFGDAANCEALSVVGGSGVAAPLVSEFCFLRLLLLFLFLFLFLDGACLDPFAAISF